jgi:hypothetical protein
MSSAVLSLEHLAQRIERQATELAKLRRVYEARQAQLADLTRRKTQLQTQLQKVEAAIQSFGKNVANRPATPATKAAKPSASALGVKPGQGISLPKLLVDIVRKAKRPLATKELLEAVVRRKYPTTSNNLQAMIETRVGELARKGILKRAGDRQGIVLGKQPAAQSALPPPVAAKKPMAAKSTTSRADRNGQNKKKSLKFVINEVLAKSSRPLTTEELAEKILASGYQTSSKNFLNVIWVGIGEMENVERVAEGYRLKKEKTPVNMK